MNHHFSTRDSSPTPGGLYVHVPFCETKCGYCDFFSVATKGRNTSAILPWLAAEMDARLGQADRMPIRTIFVGGGTPTVLPLGELEILLRSILRHVRDDPIVEFTVEANPATVDEEKAALLVRSAITRMSLGAQSFLPAELATLERIHAPEDIAPSIATLRAAGVSNINLDLIFGIPGQTVATWSTSLQRAMDLAPDHIACYGLTYEPGTKLTAQLRSSRITACDEHLEADMYFHTIDTLAAAGYEQYETSNFAQPGCECQHNLSYWRNAPFVGIGPSAAGGTGDRRYKNVADVAGYIRMMKEKGHAEAEREALSTESVMIEFIMMQLRLIEGLSIRSFVQRFGLDPRVPFGSVLLQLAEQDLLTVSDTHIALTRSGRLVADAVIRELVCACDPTIDSSSGVAMTSVPNT